MGEDPQPVDSSELRAEVNAAAPLFVVREPSMGTLADFGQLRLEGCCQDGCQVRFYFYGHLAEKFDRQTLIALPPRAMVNGARGGFEPLVLETLGIKGRRLFLIYSISDVSERIDRIVVSLPSINQSLAFPIRQSAL